MADIYDEIERYWRAHYDKARHEAPSRSEFTEQVSEQEVKSRAKTLIGLQPWLAIFEFGLEWLTYVHIALSDEGSVGPGHPNYRSPWALIGSAVAFGLSIRTLCLSGFDTPARSLLRSYVEALFLCLAILDDKTLATAFEAADDDAKVKTFWHTIASPKNLHSRIIQIEKKAGLSDDAIGTMAAWRRQEYEVLAQSSHLSYLAACLTATSPSLGESDSMRIGILGHPSSSSIRTMHYAAATTWYFSRFSYDFLLGHTPSESLLVADKENDWHRRIVFGRDVLSDVFLGHHEQNSGP